MLNQAPLEPQPAPRGQRPLSTVGLILLLDLLEFRTSPTSFDFAEFDRQGGAKIGHLPAGAQVRLNVGGLWPLAVWSDHSLGGLMYLSWCRPDLHFQIVGTDPRVLLAWHRVVEEARQ